MGTTRFELRTEIKNKRGQSPIRIIYQVRGDRRFIPTPLRVNQANWDKENQQAVYLDKKTAKQLHSDTDFDLLFSDRETKEFNRDLQNIRTEIANIEKRFELDRTPFSAEMVAEKVRQVITPEEKKAAPSKFLFDFIDEYIRTHQATREKGSLSVYKSLKTHLQDFQQIKKKQVTFEGIDYAFFQTFQTFLIDKKKYFPTEKRVKELSNTTIAKQLTTLKTFLGYARTQGIKVSDRYRDFRIKRETLDVIALTNEEFEALFYLDIAGNKRLEQVRDAFCFSCATGLRYSDLNQLRREHIKPDEIRMTIKKTKEPLTVPLNPYSRAILSKYEARLKPLPVISNQKMNRYLKELCELAKINDPIEIVRFRGATREATVYPKYELVGVHTGRKTFATLSLEKGMSAEEVMSITGHKDYKSFKRYVKITEQRKKNVMLKAWGGEIPDVKLNSI